VKPGHGGWLRLLEAESKAAVSGAQKWLKGLRHLVHTMVGYVAAAGAGAETLSMHGLCSPTKDKREQLKAWGESVLYPRKFALSI
jgi:hypothetical protein